MTAPETVDADYLVIGAGVMGMAFVDALVHHSDATVAIVDRRHAPGGHWLDAYPFVQLHQASAFYGVASTMLGGGRLQTSGPEAGMHERASASEICAYFARVMQDLIATGRVAFFPGCDYEGEGRFRSLLSGRVFDAGRARVVDAAYMAPTIPATTPPPFAVEDGARVIPVGDLVRVTEAPSEYVIVGSGKTGSDACTWLLRNGVDAEAITWVRPRDPWLLNRAVVQPDPAIFIGMAADTMAAAALASSPDDLFLRLEDAGIMLRFDTSVTPTMAKSPTLAEWELDLLRGIPNVVRHGHLRSVSRGRLRFDDVDVEVAPDAIVVHCAASGLANPPLVPIWQPDAIRPRPVRVAFPCFGAALTGYVEATRRDDHERNRVCRPSPYSNTPADWITMQIIGGDATLAMAGEADIRTWANDLWLNPMRLTAELAADPAVIDARTRLKNSIGAGRARMAEMAGMS